MTKTRRNDYYPFHADILYFKQCEVTIFFEECLYLAVGNHTVRGARGSGATGEFFPTVGSRSARRSPAQQPLRRRSASGRQHIPTPRHDKVPFLDGGECGNAGEDDDGGNGDNGPEERRDGEEEQKTCRFVGLCVGETEPFAENQCRYLIEKFYSGYYHRPYP